MKPNSVGRKYQHVEDLVITHGSHGALHAVERLANIAANPSSLEVKWDGNPVIYWGKQNGNFIMMTKNAWDYYKRGTRMIDTIPIVPSNQTDVKQFILATGGKHSANRELYAETIANLWPLLEEISPESGFLEGSFLVSPMSPAAECADSFRFQPNITLFEVLKSSTLGEKLKTLTAVIAATGFYDSVGAFVEKRAPEVTSSKSIEVLNTSYLSMESMELDIADTVKFIHEKAHDIDSFLESKPLFKTPGESIYQFLNAVQRREYIIHLFKEWAYKNLSKQRLLIINQHVFGLVAVLQTIEKITTLKNKILENSDNQFIGDIKMRNPEGYVQPHPGTEFQCDIPGQFIKLIDQRKWIPRK